MLPVQKAVSFVRRGASRAFSCVQQLFANTHTQTQKESCSRRKKTSKQQEEKEEERQKVTESNICCLPLKER